MSKQCCFIFGSGRSLLSLTSDERCCLNAHPYTLAMNKYLLYQERLGIIPKDFFLLDHQYPAQMVVNRSLRIADRMDKPPHFYLSSYYQRIFEYPFHLNNGIRGALRPFLQMVRLRADILIKYRCWMGSVGHNQITYFNMLSHKNTDEFIWAKSLSEQLYFYRGSLTSAINLAFIIYPDTDICLLGVDLNNNQYFFDEEYQSAQEFKLGTPQHLERVAMGQKQGKHVTMLNYKGHPGVQAVLPKIVSELEKYGRTLYCCSQKSLLVKENICPYRSVRQCLEP